MSNFLPDIEDGQLKEDKTPKLYTPPQKMRPLDFAADFEKRDKIVRRDAPMMADIHECEPKQNMRCMYCNRRMTV